MILRLGGLLLAVAVGLGAGVLGGLVVGVLATAGVALLTVVLAVRIETRRVEQVAEQVNRWLGPDGFAPVQLPAGRPWERLAIALNAVGAAYDRRGAKLARERPWRREIVDSLVQPALLFSSEGRLLAANDAARELLGIPLDAGAITVVQAVGSAVLSAAVREARTSEGPVTVDVAHAGHDLRAVVSLVGDEALLLVTDRTQERRVEDLRRNFVVNASHELKTPVTGIQTLAEALTVTLRTDPERVPSLIARLNGEAERLARLVHDLLDLRRLEEPGPSDRVPVDLAELIRLTVAELYPRAERRGVQVAVEAPDAAVVSGVPGDLDVIVKNLVGNAVQYNRPGGTVEVVLEERDDRYLLRVTDTGIGIPQQELGRIFERFYRVDPARSRETGGTGLGLAIVRHAVESHGGTIRVESLLGEGTTFTVELPTGPAGTGPSVRSARDDHGTDA